MAYNNVPNIVCFIASFKMTSCCDDDFNEIGTGQPAFAGRPRWGGAGLDPDIPDTVHGFEVVDVRQPDRRLQDSSLVASALRQKGIDLRQDFTSLLFDRTVFGSDLSSKEDQIAE